MTGQWTGGFQGNVTITNLGDRINGWSLVWAFPAGQQVTQSWNAVVITKELFDAVKAKGHKSVRIPVTWGNHQGTSAPYTIDAAFLSRVKQVVDWAVADNLYVLLNVHHTRGSGSARCRPTTTTS